MSLNRYAYIQEHPPVHPDAEPTYELFIGREAPGGGLLRTAQSAGFFKSIEEAVEYARWRGAAINSPN